MNIDLQHDNYLLNEQVDFLQAKLTHDLALLEAANARIAELQSENARLRGRLSECEVAMSHAKTFIATREKMHPDGQALFLDCIEKTIEALGEPND